MTSTTDRQSPTEADPARTTQLRWGAGWIAKEDYPAIVALMPDSMPPTFEAWHAGAVGRIEAAKASGHTVYLAPLRPDEFVAWCAAKGLSYGQASRQGFAVDDANWDWENPQ